MVVKGQMPLEANLKPNCRLVADASPWGRVVNRVYKRTLKVRRWLRSEVPGMSDVGLVCPQLRTPGLPSFLLPNLQSGRHDWRPLQWLNGD